MKNITQALEWRYATKQYDTTKKISEENLLALKESVRLAPTSFGLQAFTVIDVVNPELREKLKAASWEQSQITDASHLFVFAVPNDITDADINAFISSIAQTRGVPVESLAGYAGMIKGSVNSRTPEHKAIWAAKQVYIALGFLLETAALLEVDATPMEGFDNGQYNEILGLTAKGLQAVVVCTLGYRSSEDTYAGLAKVRKSADDMFMGM